MRLKWWGIFVVLFVALAQISCRKTVAPNTDRNRAPETYLTAAPLDSIGGKPLSRAPYRYAVHWSGSDIDGAVAGFYYAVTETLPGAPLPGPKPSQWHFTTKTDSVFIFDIHEGLGTDREHGFYVFAVDNEGKADPTPAFTRFVARDRNLPGIVWDVARAEGTIFVTAPGGGVTTQPFIRNLTDPQDPTQATSLPRDTIPTGSAVYFGWHGFDRDWASQISGYRYKLVETDYQKGDSLTKAVSYGTGLGGGPAAQPLPIGVNVFRVRSVDEAGGTTFPDSLRRFVVNFDPDTWWAGPDTTDPGIRGASLRDGRGLYVLGDPSGTPPAVFDKWMGPGRFNVLPADRKPMATFLEQTKIGQEMHWYIRVDSDTVARNAVALYMFAGGGDRDSPYSVFTSNPPPPDKGIVAVPGPANGSPIGVEYRTVRELTTGVPQTPSFTETYPNFDPLSPSYRPELYFTDPYTPAGGFTGKSFAQVRSVDGNTGRDHRIRSPRDYIYAYNSGDMSQAGYAQGDTVLRRLVINWFSNYNPYFLTNIVGFTPTPDTVLTNFPFTAHLFMFDSDSTSSSPAPFLLRVRIRQDNEANPPGPNDGWLAADPNLMHSGDSWLFNIPGTTPPGRNYFEFELSDFPDPDAVSLIDRRIVLARIPFIWQPTKAQP